MSTSIKKIAMCDICGEDISSSFRYHFNQHLGFDKPYQLDMCLGCYRKLKAFVKNMTPKKKRKIRLFNPMFGRWIRVDKKKPEVNEGVIFATAGGSVFHGFYMGDEHFIEELGMVHSAVAWMPEPVYIPTKRDKEIVNEQVDRQSDSGSEGD